MAKRKLINYGGDGQQYEPETGKFEIKYDDEKGNEKIKKYTSKTEAFTFYKTIKTEKSMWVYNPIPELMECHVYET